MSVLHHGTLKTSCAASHLQMGCNGTYLTIPHGKSLIAVYDLKQFPCKPLLLEGHHSNVTAQTLSSGLDPTLLCSCSDDYIIVWNISKLMTQKDVTIKGKVIGSSLGRSVYCAFQPGNLLVAVCVEKKVYILNTKEKQKEATITGHEACVTCTGFSHKNPAILVTASEDRTFKVWNIESGCMLFQSTIISSSPFISLAIDHQSESLALGTVDGQVRVYDLKSDKGYRCLHQLDVDHLLRKIRKCKERKSQEETMYKGCRLISSRPRWKQIETSQSIDSETEDASEPGSSIQAMMFVSTQRKKKIPAVQDTSPPFMQRDTSLVNDLLEDTPMLVIVTTADILQVNSKTLEVNFHFSLLDSIMSVDENEKVVNLAGSVALANCQHAQYLWCAIGNIFGNEFNVLQVPHPSQIDKGVVKDLLKSPRSSPVSRSSSLSLPCYRSNDSLTEYNAEEIDSMPLTILSCAPLLPSSPLKAELVLKPKEASPKHAGGLKSKSKVRDQAVTFRSRVKSSGYTEKPRVTMFKPKSNSKQLEALSPSFSRMAVVKQEYPMQSALPTKLRSKIDVAERPTAINSITYSGDGKSVACGLVNNSCHVFKIPLTGKGCAFVGHNGSVNSVKWSCNNKLLITSSDDKTASVWSAGLPDPILTFNMMNNNFGANKEGGLKETEENPTFSKAVKFAQFYYVDKFVLLTHGSSFNLYKYTLDTAKCDIRRYLSNNRYKLVKTFEMENWPQITAFSAVNSFHSYITMCAGSNKAIEVFDMNVGRSARTIADAHSKSIHCICQNEGSPYVSHPNNAYDLFITAAASDCIKLWDLRSDRCVHKYEGHKNRIYPCGVAISPCSRFIASGSEDRAAYVYDIRSGTYIHKLLGHTDTVGNVAFHPVYPQLLTASLDGRLRMFSDK